MVKWEYLHRNITNEYVAKGGEYFNIELNKLGKQGWELISVDEGVAYFKRLIEEPIPVYCYNENEGWLQIIESL